MKMKGVMQFIQGRPGTTPDDVFEVSGPKHMGVPDWANEEYRRRIAASLVKATSVMEKDETLTRPWWESFGFSKKKDLTTKSAIFGRSLSHGAMTEPPDLCAPTYVVAFRGTMISPRHLIEDLMQDVLVLFNQLGDSNRLNQARSDVSHLTSNLGSGSIWLAGHSLGASMALGIGRDLMLNKGHNIPTFLFNLPQVSPAWVIHKFLSEEHTTLVYTLSYKVKFGLAKIMPGYNERTERLFQQLAPWVPELYINPDDKICRGHIDYFEQRQLVYNSHPRSAETAARASYRDLFYTNKSQPHLLPSVRLWTSSTPKEEAHKLRQWWQPNSDMALSTKSYVYPLG